MLHLFFGEYYDYAMHFFGFIILPIIISSSAAVQQPFYDLFHALLVIPDDFRLSLQIRLGLELKFTDENLSLQPLSFSGLTKQCKELISVSPAIFSAKYLTYRIVIFKAYH